MKRYFLSEEVRTALVDIYTYTFHTWGEAQAERYLEGLYDKFDDIADKRTVWRDIPAAYEINGYFVRHERHIIYFRETKSRHIGILAILHSAMRPEDRLMQAFRAP